MALDLSRPDEMADHFDLAAELAASHPPSAGFVRRPFVGRSKKGRYALRITMYGVNGLAIPLVKLGFCSCPTKIRCDYGSLR